MAGEAFCEFPANLASSPATARGSTPAALGLGISAIVTVRLARQSPADIEEFLETVACVPALRRIRICASTRFNSFSFPLVLLSLRESCIRQVRLCSLGGGRRPAPNGVPPPTRLSPPPDRFSGTTLPPQSNSLGPRLEDLILCLTA